MFKIVIKLNSKRYTTIYQNSMPMKILINSLEFYRGSSMLEKYSASLQRLKNSKESLSIATCLGKFEGIIPLPKNPYTL